MSTMNIIALNDRMIEGLNQEFDRGFNMVMAARQAKLNMAARQMEMQQAAQKLPYELQALQTAGQINSLKLQDAQIQQKVALDNQAGAVELGNILAHRNFDDPNLESEVFGLLAKRPHLAQTDAFKYAMAGIEKSQQFQQAKEVADIRAKATIEAANIRTGSTGTGKNYGDIEVKEISPGSDIYAVFRPGSPGLHIVDRSGKKKDLTLTQKASVGRSISLMKKELLDMDPGPDRDAKAGFIQELEAELQGKRILTPENLTDEERSQLGQFADNLDGELKRKNNSNTSPQLASPPSLKRFTFDPVTGDIK